MSTVRPDPAAARPELVEEARDLLDSAVELRRTLHQWPEVGNELPITQEAVLAALEGLPLDVVVHETTSGVTGLLTGSQPGPTIVLRGDMDALPMHEDTGLDFSSRHDDVMHACGHDTHTSMLVHAAKQLSAHRDELAGRVLFMFQPGEEGHHGARFMLEEGLLDVPTLADGTPSPVTGGVRARTSRRRCRPGTSAAAGGAIMASADRLVITVTGKGGHASEPYRAIDPIPVACEMVQALQLMVTRSIDVFDPAVVTVGRISAGTTNNVIPETAEIEGTIRAVSESTRAKVHAGIRRVVDGIAAAHNCAADVDVEAGYPVTVNDTDFAERALATAREVAGRDHVVRFPNPIMGAEDWSYVLQKVPGSMMFLGGTPEGKNPATAPPNHSNRVTFDEPAMVNGIATYTAVALRHLGALGPVG